MIRLDTKEGENFNLKPKDILKAVEEWSMTEVFELRDVLLEVETKSLNGETPRDAFLSMFPDARESIINSCK